MFFRFKKFTVMTAMAVFVFITVFGVFFPVRSVRAIPVEVTADVPLLSLAMVERMGKMLEISILNGAITAISYFTRKIAYDMAVGLASGDWGQTPLAHNTSWGQYMKDTADQAAGLALEKLGGPFGLNLCKIPDIRVDLALRIGLGRMFNPEMEKPECTFSQAYGQWTNADNWRSQYGSKEAIDKRFNRDFKVDESDFGIALRAREKIDSNVATQRAEAKSAREEGQGAKGVTDLIAGNVKTPSQVVKKQFEDTSPSEQQKMEQGKIWGTFGAGVAQVIPSALHTFLNTYISLKLNRLLNGILPSPRSSGDAFSFEDFGSTPENSGRRAAQDLFSTELQTAAGNIVAAENFDLLSQLFACPEDGNYGPFNCVIDEGLYRTLQKATYGLPPVPSTIAEAIADGSLHADWQLIPQTSESNIISNMDRNCRDRAYCYGNIKVLRLARILPMGFEIAVALSNPDVPWTLGGVVKGFDDCERNGNGDVVYDPTGHPFCHLIDPNWVIKLPQSRCGALAYGTTPLISGVPDRQQECVNLQSCVQRNSDGTCASYGYCTKEQNVWNFSADSCSSQFATCKTFTNQVTGAQASYLYRTLDAASCSDQTVGCTAYSLNQDDSYNWQSPSNSNAKLYNDGIYFNNNLPTTACSQASAGCSAFDLSDPVGEISQIYLKKAPDYFGCYKVPGSNAWPATDLALAQLQPKAECNNFAKACIADEVGCSWYTPVTYSGSQVPGKFTPATFNAQGQVSNWGDQCDAKCVGYAAYRELNSNYANGEDPVYITPPSSNNTAVKSCTAAEEGCASFTNLNQNAGQLEKVEYYSFLRSCIKPDPIRQKNFFTYEGTVTEGFQLKTFTLVVDADGSSDPSRLAGGPEYSSRTAADIAQMKESCNAGSYNGHTASTDCRQFNDDRGKIYYRLLSKTVAVSEQCTDYRLNSTDTYHEPAHDGNAAACALNQGLYNDGQCQLCFQGGEYRDGYCFYSGLPEGVQNNAGVSDSCSAAMNTCRAYKGNNGNNIENIFTDNFENSSVSQALAGWSKVGGSLFLSVESTHAGEHSLGFANAGKLQKTLNLSANEDYSLTFWAKGSNQSVNINFNDDVNLSFGTISIGNAWRLYRLGPVKFTGEGNNARLVFTTTQSGNVFLDNVELTKVRSLLYLVKNTLIADSLCDSNPNDNLPGEALGCSAYTAGNNQPYYLTNFSRLCREGAIGCVAVRDTFNTQAAKNNIYNLWLPGEADSEAKITLSGTASAACFVPAGERGCYIKNIFDEDIDEILLKKVTTGRSAVETNNNPSIVDSTVVIPADTAIINPVYLVANRESACNQVDLGCSLAGVKTETPSGVRYVTTTIKNDPSLYEQTLCQSEAVGCSAFNSSAGNYYAKDPLAIGNKLCVYREAVDTGNGTLANGWFWKGVGVCQGSTDYCSVDTDCGAGVTCQGKDVQPCYPDYVINGNQYGIWSSGTRGEYQDFVGECPSNQNQCAELADRNDQGKKYYLINDEKLTAGSDECSGQVSEREGCILMDNTEFPNKLWNTKGSYAASVANNFDLAAPVTGNPDANTIVKVTRDRECAEWGYCSSYTTQIDENSGQRVIRCSQLGLCSQADTSIPGARNSAVGCANPVTDTSDSRDKVLDAPSYVERGVAWGDRDYSGYSIFNAYNILDLKPLFSERDQKRYLVYSLGSAPDRCLDNGEPTDNVACGPANSGFCLAGECVYPAARRFSSASGRGNSSLQAEAMACRGYPEKSSPFPPDVLAGRSDELDRPYKQGFENVNLCSGGDCDCDYAKVTYGDNQFNKYFGPGTPAVDFCSGGPDDGKECTRDPAGSPTNCSSPAGVCLKAKKKAVYSGWSGYCLERDIRREINGTAQKACLTWWPLDIAAGVGNIFLQNDDAGYTEDIGIGPNANAYLCLQNSYGNGVTEGENDERRNQNKILYSGINPIYGDFTSYEGNSSPFNPADSLEQFYDGSLDDLGAGEGAGVFTIDKMNKLGGGYNRLSPGPVDRYGFWSQVLGVDEIEGNDAIITRRDDILFLGCRYYHNSIKKSARSEYADLNAEGGVFTGNDVFFCPFTPDSFNGGINDRRDGEWIAENNFDVTSDGMDLDDISQIDIIIDKDDNDDFKKITPNVFAFRPKLVDGEWEMDGAVAKVGNEAEEYPSGYDVLNSSDGTDTAKVVCDDHRKYWQLSVCDQEQGEAQCSGVGVLNKGINYQLNRICGNNDSRNNDANNFFNVSTNSGVNSSASMDYNDHGFIARVVADQNNKILGVQFIISHEVGAEDVDVVKIGFEIAVHFKERAKCKDIVQIAKKQTGFPPALSSSKPVTWYLAGQTSLLESPFPSPWGDVTLFQEGPRAGGDPQNSWPSAPFGLADLNTISADSLSPTPVLFINPFDYYVEIGSGKFLSANAPWAKAGVPLKMNPPGAADVCINPGDCKIDTLSLYNDFKRMFQKIYGHWVFRDGGYRLVTDDLVKKDYAASPVGNLPRIAAVDMESCDESGKNCAIKKLDDFTINSSVGKDVIGEKNINVSIRFYAWADPAHMPLKRVVIDPGDDGELPAPLQPPSALGNYKPYCGANYCGGNSDVTCSGRNGDAMCESLGLGGCGINHIPVSSNKLMFGNTADTGCQPEYMQFNKDYSCVVDSRYITNMAIDFASLRADNPNSVFNKDDPSSAGHYAVLVDNPRAQYEIPLSEEARAAGLRNGDVVCAFLPRVQVLDNWGWCSGRCARSYDGDDIPVVGTIADGCYNERALAGEKTKEECEIGISEPPQANVDPWVYFSDKNNYIIVTP